MNRRSSKTRLRKRDQLQPIEPPQTKQLSKVIWAFISSHRHWATLASIVTVASFPITIITLCSDKSQLILSLGEQAPLDKSSPTYFFFNISEVKDDAKYALPIRVKLNNNSDFRADSVTLTFQYNRMHLRHILPNEAFTENPKRLSNQQHYEVKHDGKFDYAIYSNSFMPPYESFTVTDAAFATRIPYDPNAPILYNSWIGLDTKISVRSQQEKEQEWQIRYRGLSVPTHNDVIQVMKKFYIPQIAFEIRKESNFFEYAWKLLFGRKIAVYSYSPKFNYFGNA